LFLCILPVYLYAPYVFLNKFFLLIKKKKNLTWPLSTYSFSDSVRRRCSVLQWNPDVATQLVVALDEDSSPSVRVLTMRLMLLL